MDTYSNNFKLRLGLFVIAGLLLFVAAIFVIGRQKNLFNPVFRISSTFHNVSGLLVGNNVRFSGINVGTVDNLSIINDSTVRVDMLIKKDVEKFIRKDCKVAISSEGLIGDRILVIHQGSADSSMAMDGQSLNSFEPIETDAIMASLQISAVNAEIITDQLAEILVKVNNGNGTLGRLIQDESLAENLNQTMMNLKKSSAGLNENMEAAKSNFLLRGYFKKKESAAQKKIDDIAKKKKDDLKAENKKAIADKKKAENEVKKKNKNN